MMYTLKNQASSITSRTEQTLFAQSHSFAPPNGRLIKFQMASAAEWCQLDTVKFVAEIENLNQLEDGAARAPTAMVAVIPGWHALCRSRVSTRDP